MCVCVIFLCVCVCVCVGGGVVTLGGSPEQAEPSPLNELGGFSFPLFPYATLSFSANPGLALQPIEKPSLLLQIMQNSSWSSPESQASNPHATQCSEPQNDALVVTFLV